MMQNRVIEDKNLSKQCLFSTGHHYLRSRKFLLEKGFSFEKKRQSESTLFGFNEKAICSRYFGKNSVSYTPVFLQNVLKKHGFLFLKKKHSQPWPALLNKQQ